MQEQKKGLADSFRKARTNEESWTIFCSRRGVRVKAPIDVARMEELRAYAASKVDVKKSDRDRDFRNITFDASNQITNKDCGATLSIADVEKKGVSKHIKGNGVPQGNDLGSILISMTDKIAQEKLKEFSNSRSTLPKEKRDRLFTLLFSDKELTAEDEAEAVRLYINKHPSETTSTHETKAATSNILYVRSIALASDKPVSETLDFAIRTAQETVESNARSMRRIEYALYPLFIVSGAIDAAYKKATSWMEYVTSPCKRGNDEGRSV